MAKDVVYQCCYTNAERSVAGQVRDSGWNFVNISKDIPRVAMQTCQSIQQRYSAMLGNMRDERGQAIRDFYEVLGNGSYLFVTRTRYGLRDRVGRPNLFSHAFVFPAESAAPHPERFLYPDFKASVEETSDLNPQIPENKDSFGEVIGSVGLGSREIYAKLIQCVYLKLAANPLLTVPASFRDTPLYIQYDGTPEQFRGLLRCVYSALPYYLRARLSASMYTSARNAADAKRNLIFTMDAKAQGGFYFILPSGENNVVDTLNKRAADIIGGSYVGYAARELSADAFAPFFEGLDACARDLGDADASNDRVLNIAWKYFWSQETTSWNVALWDRNTRQFSLRDGIPHEELKRLLSNIFSCEIYSGGMASLACQIVETVGADELTDSLREKWKAYSSRMEPDEPAPVTDSEQAPEPPQTVVDPVEALKHLLDIPYSDKALETELREFSGAPEILRQYSGTLLTSESISWDLLKSVRTALTLIPPEDREGLDNVLHLKAAELCTEDIQIGKNPAFALHEYELSAGLVMTGQDVLRAALDNMRELYWDIFQWNTFDFRKAEEYRCFGIEGQKNKVLSLLDLSERYVPHTESEFLLYVHQYFKDFQGEIDSAARLTILNSLCERLKKQYAPHLYEDWVKWASYVNVGDDYIDVIRQLYESLHPFDVSKLLDAYRSFRKKNSLWNQNGLDKDEKRRIVGRVQSACIQNDTKECPVPLDLWLMIGLDSGGNPFEIFDRLLNFWNGSKCEPSVFRQNPAEVVRSSVALTVRNMMECAVAYVNSPGKRKPRDIVHKWLKEWMKSHPAQSPKASVNRQSGVAPTNAQKR